MIPERALREIAVFRNGLNFSATQVGEGVRVVGVGDIDDAHDIDFESLTLVRPTKA